jgi:hypothetical protein
MPMALQFRDAEFDTVDEGAGGRPIPSSPQSPRPIWHIAGVFRASGAVNLILMIIWERPLSRQCSVTST